MLRFLVEYMSLSAGSKALLVVHEDARHLAEELELIGKAVGIQCQLANADEEFITIVKQFPRCDVVVYLERNSSTHRNEVLEYLDSRGSNEPRLFRAYDFTPELFELSLRVPRHQLLELNERLIATGSRTDVVTATSDLGTDLQIGLDHKFGWIDSCAQFDGKRPGVFPPSEVATYSPAINGIVVANGAINTNFGYPGDPRLEETPVTLEIVESRVRRVDCEHPIVQSIIERLLEIENCDRIGEVGFGTNIGIDRFVPFVSHINERFPCLHLGLGANNQGQELAGWQASVHLDVILGKCELCFDRERVLKDGRYTLDAGEMQEVGEHVMRSHADTV
jgi:leucyl aminopeptidase (aminopeptidase T)